MDIYDNGNKAAGARVVNNEYLDYGAKKPGRVMGIPKKTLLVRLVEFMEGKQKGNRQYDFCSKDADEEEGVLTHNILNS